MEYLNLHILIVLGGVLGVVTVKEPVNHPFSVSAGKPTPDLACTVGFHSIDSEDFYKVNCSEAHKIEVPVSWDRRKDLGWEKTRKTIRFGTRPDNTPWHYEVTSWVCSIFPQAGTVTYDCLPENEAPPWYKKPIDGPAPGPYGSLPGCNGFVCFCNHEDYCNLVR